MFHQFLFALCVTLAMLVHVQGSAEITVFASESTTQKFTAVSTKLDKYVAGVFTGKTLKIGSYTLTNTDTSGLTTDVFVAKYDINDKLVWANSFGSNKNDTFKGIATDEDKTQNSEKFPGVWVVGEFSGSVLKIPGQSSQDVNNNGASGTTDLYFVKFDVTLGIVNTTLAIGGTQNEEYIHTGYANGDYSFIANSRSSSFKTQPRKNPSSAAYTTVETPDAWYFRVRGLDTTQALTSVVKGPVADYFYFNTNNYHTSGDFTRQTFSYFTGKSLTNTDSTGQTYDAFYVKLLSNGAFSYYVKFGGAKNERFGKTAFTRDTSEDILMTGTFNSNTLTTTHIASQQTDPTVETSTNRNTDGSDDIFVFRSFQTNTRWVTTIGGTGKEIVDSVMIMRVSGLNIVAGRFHSPTLYVGSNTFSTGTNNATSSDAFITIFDKSASTSVATILISGSGTEVVFNMTQDSNNGGNFYVVGYFDCPVLTVGTQTLVNNGGMDIFVAKISTAGAVAWLKGFGGAGDDMPLALARLSSDSTNMYIIGTFSNTFTFGTTTFENDAGVANKLFVAGLDTTGTLKYTYVSPITTDGGDITLYEGIGVFVMSGVAGTVLQESSELNVVNSGSRRNFLLTVRTQCNINSVQCGGVGTCSSGACTCPSTHYADGLVCKLACSGNGILVNSKCKCNSGWTGDQCDTVKTLVYCYGIADNETSVCSGHGACVDTDNCTCSTGYSGDDCDTFYCSGELFNASSVCSSHGDCLAPDSCQCETGYVGEFCQVPICYGKMSNESSVCGGHGNCSKTDSCDCDNGYGGEECQWLICDGKTSNETHVCGGHGSCEAPDSCTCINGWSGEFCEETLCYGSSSNSSKACSGRGTCVAPNSCRCNMGYAGYICQRNCAYCFTNY